MHYTIRAFLEGRYARVDGMCRVFSLMERTAYSLLRGESKSGAIKQLLRERYGVRNARWIQSAINQGNAVMESQENNIEYRIELCKVKIRNTKEKMKRLSNPLKVAGCEAKIVKYESKIKELQGQLTDRSYPRAVFGSKELLRQMRISSGERHQKLKEEWRDKRSNHLFSVGQANQRGNGNVRLSFEGCMFHLEVRNWFGEDFKLPLRVPEYARGALKDMIERGETVKIGKRGEVTQGGLAYSIRVIRCEAGYQVLISFKLEGPPTEWNGLMAGIDINPEGIACTVISSDGNLIATRFLEDNRLISASKSKRKWVLENTINKMLRWCLLTHHCNALAVEELNFKGAYDYTPETNFKLSNFMRKKMLEVVKLHALKMKMLFVVVNPAYSSRAAVAKYGKQLGGFNRHQLAAFVIARRALGYGEPPVLNRLPNTKNEKRMWNHCIRYYGYSPAVQTLLHHEPMERKSGGDDNGGGGVTKLLRAPPATTSERGLSHNAPANDRMGAVDANGISGRRAGWALPNGHTSQGDGARGHRVNPPGYPSAFIFKEDNVTC